METGDARLVRIVAVDDCGRIMNPMLAEGQVHGGLTQGAAQALYEGVEYDDQGNPLTGTLMSYGMPSAAELISWDTIHTQTPTFLNPLGAKGIGESGTIGSTPAVQNAVVDAVLAPGRAPHRHAADARTGLARNPRGAGRAGDATRVTTVERFDDPRAFRSVAEPFLMRDEARHNLQLGICRRLEVSSNAYGDEAPYLSVARDGDEIVAVTIRTPPFELLVSTTRLDAVDAIAEDVRESVRGPAGVRRRRRRRRPLPTHGPLEAASRPPSECRSASTG